jgi:hypothetical protein
MIQGDPNNQVQNVVPTTEQTAVQPANTIAPQAAQAEEAPKQLTEDEAAAISASVMLAQSLAISRLRRSIMGSFLGTGPKTYFSMSDLEKDNPDANKNKDYIEDPTNPFSLAIPKPKADNQNAKYSLFHVEEEEY